ncbi:hypothetical protein D1B31_21985 [Neobacillus notoginsengisoli]|uniref:Uncharacterized protein n=1 Tax=Neobacillus notoginsengisoli TaxID=1578198 RepID=A0A417YFE6_9BACI|nr:hypothetical protein D1B31_21985 [Neobacillus notoginsengisoli]
MSNFTCEDFRRKHRFFCNEFAPLLRHLNLFTEEDECASDNPIRDRQFSCCCRLRRHHHHGHEHDHEFDCGCDD